MNPLLWYVRAVDLLTATFELQGLGVGAGYGKCGVPDAAGQAAPSVSWNPT